MYSLNESECVTQQRKEMNSIKFIEINSKLFQFFGICIVNNHPHRHKLEIYSILLNFIIILILTTLLFVTHKYNNYILYSLDAVGYLGSVLELICPFCAHFIILFETIYFQNVQRKIWKNIKLIENELNDLNIDQQKNAASNFFKKYFIQFIMLNAICLINESIIISIIYFINFDPIWMRNWLIRMLSFITGRIAICQFLIFINYLTNRYELINQKLIQISTQRLTSMNNNKITRRNKYLIQCSRQQQIHELNKLKYLYNIMTNITIQINQRFGCSILGLITNFIICITVDYYWVFVNLYYKTYSFIGSMCSIL